jgi:hypothetical protein
VAASSAAAFPALPAHPHAQVQPSQQPWAFPESRRPPAIPGRVQVGAFTVEVINPEEQPVDPEMLARINDARVHPSAGIPHEEILREFGA